MMGWRLYCKRGEEWVHGSDGLADPHLWLYDLKIVVVAAALLVFGAGLLFILIYVDKLYIIYYNFFGFHILWGKRIGRLFQQDFLTVIYFQLWSATIRFTLSGFILSAFCVGGIR